MANRKAGKKKKKGPLLTDDQRSIVRIIAGLLCLVACIFTLAALVSYAFTWRTDQSLLYDPNSWRGLSGVQNICGKVGFLWADFLIAKLFGIGAFFVPFFIGVVAVYCLRITKVHLLRTLLLSLFGCIIFSLLSAYIAGFIPAFANVFTNSAGGSYGGSALLWLTNMLGMLGAGAVIFLMLFIWLTFCTKKVALWCDSLVYNAFHAERKGDMDVNPSEPEDDTELDTGVGVSDTSEDVYEEVVDVDMDDLMQEEEEVSFVSLAEAATASVSDVPREEGDAVDIEFDGESEDGDRVELTIESDDNDYLANLTEEEKARIYDPRLDLSHYKFPSIDMLEDYRKMWHETTNDELERNKTTIVNALANFKIKVDRIVAKSGPTVTLYKIHLSEGGTRIAQVKRLEEDIAMYLGTTGVRVFVLPGAIGIEVANENPSVVPLKMVLNSPQFKEARERMELPVAFGITVTNEPFFIDLAKMPHLLIAGATGTGKSVGLNTLITSLLYTKHPSELKFVMVDPKKVELDFYQKLENHYFAMLPDAEEAIITDTKKVINTLKSLCTEMDSRYDLLRQAKVRKITEYNEKFLKRQLNPAKGHQYLPYIVVIIDEFGDLLITAGREIEEPIARLAQKARAVGIHLVFATQRPTTNVITGTIKANFNARVAFKVMSSVDSKTILDQVGANRLIGRGDMLVVYPGAADLIRVQCALIETNEVDRITEFIGRQQGYTHPYYLPECEEDGDDSGVGAVDLHKRDKFFSEAAKIIVQTQQGSTSLLQRKLEIGHNKAGRIMDQLEAAGIVGPSNGSKARNVLISDYDELDKLLKSLDNI